jgi:hypothetical protein
MLRTLIALSLVFIPSLSARAELCPAPVDHPALASVDSEQRLSFLLGTMEHNARRLHVWSLVWGTTYAAATAAQLVALPLVQGGARIDLTAGAISAAVGSASLYLLPLRITSASKFEPSELEDSDRCKVLASVEQRFFDTAKIDRLSASWIGHAGNVAINAALALILGLGYGRWESAAISAAVGLAVGEANLLTQPHGLMSAEDKYLNGGVLDSEHEVGSWRIAPIADRSQVGLAVAFAL